VKRAAKETISPLQLWFKMRRFFFDLQGAQNANDPAGLQFETDLDAFRAAQRLAAEIGGTRPQLCGNTWIAVMSRKTDGEAFYVSV
jgi:hypothetical protein